MRLMIIGNIDGQLNTATKIAHNNGYKVIYAEDTAQAFTYICNGKGADLLIVEISEDIANFKKILEMERIHLPIIACGIRADARTAAASIRAGAIEYIPLPPNEELIAAILQSITGEAQSIIHNSNKMRDLLKIADKVAPSNASILITGESGTGKEIIANYVHKKSKRAKGNFISLNCAAIPENLLESELFGHEKGAFTGATNRRIGKFEEANGGTLFLDEITEMDISLQAKLLRAIQEREITRLGSNEIVKVDIRILATSNRNLLEAVENKILREDLYFRLNVINIHIPPLRERLGDIKPLAQYFADKFAKSNGIDKRIISDEALEKLQKYHWRGNVRELENIIHRAVLMAMNDEIESEAITLPDQIEEEKMNDNLKTPNVSNLVGQTVSGVEKELIIQTLNHCLGNRTHAANILGISIRTMRNKLNQYGISQNIINS